MIHQKLSDSKNQKTILWSTKLHFFEQGICLDPHIPYTTEKCDCVWNVWGSHHPYMIQEVKCRFVSKNAFTNLLIDKSKIDGNIELAEKKCSGKFLLTIWWGEDPDGDSHAHSAFLTKPIVSMFSTTHWGRNMPRDGYDTDVCYEVPVGLFQIKMKMARKRIVSLNASK